MNTYLIKKTFRALGLDIRRIANEPTATLLGFGSLPIATVIDVGANRGQFARYISGFFPNARIYCFEPLKEPFLELQAWAAQRSSHQIMCYNLAAGETAGVLELNHHTEHAPSSSFLKSTKLSHSLYPQTESQRKVNVEVVTLDEFFAGKNIEEGIFLKLDVQGYEDRVLRGARNILRSCSACLFEVSVENLYNDQADFFALNNEMFKAGLKYKGNLSQTCDKNGRVLFMDCFYARK